MSQPVILRWARAIPLGFYRSLVLVGLTVMPVAVAAAVGFGGSLFTLGWSARLTSPLIVKVLATVGELAVAGVWVAVASWFMLLLTSRPLSKAARRCARRWLALPIEVSYRPAPTIIRMATGYWWNGYEYEKSEREARRRGRILSRAKDPQLRRDAIWFLVAAVTVVPVAALPWLGLAGGVYLAVTPGALGYGIGVLVASLVIAPFAWRILGPVASRFLGPPPQARLDKRVEELESIRTDLTHTRAAELERIERGLHGAQARLVALGMSMEAADHLVDADPEAAKAILAEARALSVAALTELRSLIRGINPPVLSERGLVDAVRALALDAPMEITVRSTVTSRPERPVESAVYFAVAELLANVAKHARATEVTVELGYGTRMLTATVTDDGRGGAAASEGSGLAGIERRAAALRGTDRLDHPLAGLARSGPGKPPEVTDAELACLAVAQVLLRFDDERHWLRAASGRPLPAAGPSHVGLAEIAYQRDELDLALRHASEGIALCRQFVHTTPLADGLATLAMIRQARGDPAGALEAVTEAVQASPGLAGLLNPVPAQRARLLLAQGDLAAAARFPQDNGLGPDDEPDYARESGHLVLARILLAQDRPGPALALLDRLHAAAVAQGRGGGLIETGALRALALAAAADEAGAVTALAQALKLACPQGYVRVFADEGPPMAALLGRLIAAQRAGRAAAGVPLGYLARLQRAFGAGAPARDPVPSGIVDPLTSRELEVLEMLAAGRPNQAIAGELVVTLDTVKKHVGHVLAKLGAANRTEAVARARELSLIP